MIEPSFVTPAGFKQEHMHVRILSQASSHDCTGGPRSANNEVVTSPQLRGELSLILTHTRGKFLRVSGVDAHIEFTCSGVIGDACAAPLALSAASGAIAATVAATCSRRRRVIASARPSADRRESLMNIDDSCGRHPMGDRVGPSAMD
jgi:hypothetical protein